jgi:hypothetical protein
MNTKVVRNITENELTIPEVGSVKAGGTITVPAEFNSANFEVVKSDTKKEEVKEEAKEVSPKKFNNK